MSARDFLKTTKGKVITIGGVAVVAIGIAAAVLLQGDGYRSIAVQEVAGSVNVTGEKNNGEAYVGEHLYSGDDVTVMDKASLTMCMDNDKYVYADANTHFKLEASGAKEDSKIKINLDQGSELNDLQSKLGPNDSYEVDTPNSTMSVRGTRFRVTVFETSYGVIYTLVEVDSGEVLVRLKASNGSYTGEEKLLTAGQSALIRSDADTCEFVVGERLDSSEVDRTGSDDTGMLMLTYDALPKDGMERLIELIMDIETEGTETSADVAGDTSGANTGDKPSAAAETAEGNISANGSTDAAGANAAAKVTPEPTKHVHKAGDWTVTVKAGCLTEGQMQQKCTECGEVMGTKAVPATGHIPGDWVYLGYPTCTNEGARQQVCAQCGAVLAQESIPATGHNWSGWEGGSEPTCTSGSTETRTCADCGATETNSESALGHDWYATGNSNGNVAAGPTQYEYRCSRCGATEWR